MLADPLDPIILADGTKVDPTTGKAIKEKKKSNYIAIPSASEAQEIVAKTRRSTAELPLPSNQMNIVSLILFYTLWGLSDQDIAITVGNNITIAQVSNIKKLPEYKSMITDIQKTILEHEAGDIRNFFIQRSTEAANKVVSLMDEDGALGFAAAKEVLDRGGFRPADVVEHRHKMEDSLKIEFIQKNTNNNLPSMELEGDFINITPKGKD